MISHQYKIKVMFEDLDTRIFTLRAISPVRAMEIAIQNEKKTPLEFSCVKEHTIFSNMEKNVLEQIAETLEKNRDFFDKNKMEINTTAPKWMQHQDDSLFCGYHCDNHLVGWVFSWGFWFYVDLLSDELIFNPAFTSNTAPSPSIFLREMIENLNKI